jgi:hypothetical protein
LAIAGHAASGGLAIASQYAVGGEARAAHANDPAAQEYMATSLLRFARFLRGDYFWVWLVLLVGPTVPLSFLTKRIATKPPSPDKDWSE